ncbi:MAG: peptidylprolyl isomerase [Flammeovirgaceae bacterium]
MKKKTKNEKPKPEELIQKNNVRERLLAYGKENPETLVLISTNFGDIKVKLYEETPLHRANFIRLVKRGYYDNTLFYRVISGFIMQGGGSDVRNPVKIGKYRIPSEFNPEKFIHKKGALAAARYYEDNPKKESDSHDFYLVHGEKISLAALKETYKKLNLTLSPEAIKIYTSIGGAPHLDGEHTVFGEVVSGMEVIEKVTSLEVDGRQWPKEDVTVKMIVLE